MWRLSGFIFSVITLISGVQHVVRFYKKEMICLSGLGFKNIDIVGKHRTTTNNLFWGLNMKKNDIIWASSLSTIKKRLESLPWVQSATVKRCLPSTIHIDLKERSPFSVWHHRTMRHVLDKKGHTIHGAQLSPSERDQLLHISGSEAPQNMFDLVRELGSSSFFSRIKLAVFLRSGRWDLYLKDGTLIQCPEDNLRDAVDQINAFPEILDGAMVIDLRFDGAILYRKKVEIEQK